MFSFCLFAKVSISQRTEKQPLVSFTHMALVQLWRVYLKNTSELFVNKQERKEQNREPNDFIFLLVDE